MKAVKRNDKRESGGSGLNATSLNSNVQPSRVIRHVASPPTTVELRGVPVHFPFKPYKCQEDYMGKVLDALFSSENALLESPTGTGKTLCLLCATLAWQRTQAQRLKSEDPGDFAYTGHDKAVKNDTNKVHRKFNGRNSVGPTFGLGVNEDMDDNNSNDDDKDGSMNGKSENRARRVPTIIYASRTHSQLSQVVRELRNTRYRPKHAVLGSREQMCVNPKVKRATSIASEINHDCSKLTKDRKCRFRNRLDGFQPPSNESGGGNHDGTQPVMDMEDLLKMGDTHKICPFYYTRSLLEEAELVLIPYNYLFDRDSRKTTLAEIAWDNAVVIFDEAHNLESFASESASFDLTSLDIAGCVVEVQRALNLMDAMADQREIVKKENIFRLKSIFLQLEEYILNLDETRSAFPGEYMMQIFTAGASITHANHHLFIGEVRKLTDIFMEVQGSNSRGAPRLDHFVQCVKRVFGEPTEARCLAKAQSYRVHVTPKGTGASTSGKNGSVGRTVSYWCFAPSEAMRELAGLNIRSILVTSGTLSPLESYALELGIPFPHRLENPHIVSDDQIYVRVLGKGVSGKLLTSSYERRQDADYYQELGNTLVSLSRIIPGGMLVFFPSYGVMETCMERWGGPSNSRSAHRNKAAAFFAARKKHATGSSRYSFPQVAIPYNTSGENLLPWKRLLGNKAVVTEPKSTADLTDAISEFHKYLNMPKSNGVVLMGVCRGKISEGIDFSHDMCRAVIITGLPFAPSFDPKVKMKREFLDQHRVAQSIKSSAGGGFGDDEKRTLSLSGHEWYTQQAHRAVNQAIGRVIRNKNDYGSVLLLDSRFGLPGNQQGLSSWVRPHVSPDEGVGRCISTLVKFYRNAEKKSMERATVIAAPPPPPPPTAVSRILQYEEDENENQSRATITEGDGITKVALIAHTSHVSADANHQTAGLKSSVAGTAVDPAYVRPENIIARVDVKSARDAKHVSKMFDQEQPESHDEKDGQGPDDSKMSPLPSKLQQPATAATPHSPQPPTASESKMNSSIKVQLGTPATGNQQSPRTEPSPSKSAAQLFFHKIRTQMSPSEQSKIKKSVMSMKQFTKPNQRKEFVNSAGGVIKILLLHEKFEGRSRANQPETIILFFQLLPPHFIHHMQKRTMDLILRDSDFLNMLKQRYGSEEVKCRPEISNLLKQLWFDKKPLSATTFLKRFESFLQLNDKSDKRLFLHLLPTFLKLIPVDFHAPAKAYAKELKISRDISRMKKVESTSVGENSIQIERFQNNLVKNLNSLASEPPPPSSLQTQASPQSEPSSSTSNSASGHFQKLDLVQTSSGQIKANTSTRTHHDGQKAISDKGNDVHQGTPNGENSKKRANPYPISNPYAKKANAQATQKPDGNGGNTNSTTRPIGKRTKSLASIISAACSKRVEKVLHQSQAHTYTGQGTATASSSSSVASYNMKSNTPKDMVCTICEQRTDKSFIAECGHLACYHCWMKWFKKANTCPVCRKNATKDTLALAVFKK